MLDASNAPIQPASTRTGPLSPTQQDEYADRLDALFDQQFASERRGDEVTDEEFAEAIRWLVEGPRLSTEELLTFLERNKRLQVDTDRMIGEIVARAQESRTTQKPNVP